MGTLEKPRTDANSGDSYILTREMFKLTLPSDELATFLRSVERAVLQCMSKHGVHNDMAFTTARYLRLDTSIQIGCLDHSDVLKKKLLKFYLIMRMFHASDAYNAQVTEKEARKIKSHSKTAKVI